MPLETLAAAYVHVQPMQVKYKMLKCTDNIAYFYKLISMILYTICGIAGENRPTGAKFPNGDN